jgi:hypothetical protein
MAFQAVAIAEVLAWRITEAMKAKEFSRMRLAERHSRDGNVALVSYNTCGGPARPKVSMELMTAIRAELAMRTAGCVAAAKSLESCLSWNSRPHHAVLAG